MRSPRCALAALVPGERWLSRHRQRCLPCQAAASREKSLQRSLASLGRAELPAPSRLQAAVAEHLGRQDGRNPRREIMARAVARYLTAAGVAVGTVVALVTGLARRHSRPLGRAAG